mgnify:CR=1 FL=1
MTSLLRLATAGSVDDGKSTLVGRLLFDSKSILADQFEAVERVSRDRGLETTDLALVTDGLRSEREQGITIDVAYRYFATEKRTFILADCPGHVQYTRNTVTGSSTADVLVVLVDVRKGVQEQTRRHLAVASLLRVPHVIVAINKIDLVDFDQAVYEQVASDVQNVALTLGVEEIHTAPVSALLGDNVVERSTKTPWYDGPSVLELLETLPVSREEAELPFALPVQLVIRPQSSASPEFRDYRGYAGKITSGTVRVGDAITVLPSGLSSTISGIDFAGENLEQAQVGESVTIRLSDDIDISRGDLIVATDAAPVLHDSIEATVAWLADKPLSPGARVLVKHGTKTVQGIVTDVLGKLELDSGTVSASANLELNDIGEIGLRFAEPLPIEDYARTRANGAFLLIDPHAGTTLAAGMAGTSTRVGV